jgi:hypothetical protein
MKKLYLLLAALFALNFANSQPSIQWQKSLGGTSNDYAYSIRQTTDGGYIVAGYSYSNDGDITGHYGTTTTIDYWVVKLDSTGTIQWQKSLGGTNSDGATSVQQTTDGGYIVAGSSYSNDEDVTGHHGVAGGYCDYWIVKLNSTGTIEWQKSLGGSGDDIATSIQQTTDSGYIVAGHSDSNDGDVTGHYGGTCFHDYWIVKLDKTGTIVWQKSLGGINDDIAESIRQTTDGGYIIAGYSYSNDGDDTGHHDTTEENPDYWVVKLNSTGTIIWQKSFGGFNEDWASSIQQTTDGGYIVSGSSNSNDGDVTGHHGTAADCYDYWVVKLNSTGTIEWQKSLGGIRDDWAFSIQQTTDDGYIVTGHSYSIDGDIMGHIGTISYCDYWVVKLNATGTLAWQKSLGGAVYDLSNSIQQTTDGGYIVSGYSWSNDGDITGHHGTTDFDDYWIVKLFPVSGVNELSKNNSNLNIYPNPANNLITIETNAINNGQLSINNGQITIINIKGQEVKSLNFKDCKLQIDVSDLPGGLYFVKVRSEQGVSIAKFVKE